MSAHRWAGPLGGFSMAERGATGNERSEGFVNTGGGEAPYEPGIGSGGLIWFELGQGQIATG